MPKRKSVRFVEDEQRTPSDKELLKLSAKRRPGDQTIETESDGYDVGPGPSMGDVTRSVKNYKGQHTLDSDEEEEEKDQKLNVNDVDGQEEATIEFDDETKITPFNMREELEEGYYDAEENFVFKKKKEEIKDAWLDNIDWASIKKNAGSLWNQDQLGDDDDDETPTTVVDRLEVYKNILSYMQPNETITKTLKRLGGNRDASNARKQRWREKKNLKIVPTTEETGKPVHETTSISTDTNASDVVKLTEYVDQLVSDGEFEVYGFTFEKLTYEIETRENMKKFRDDLSTKAEISSEDADLDMFAENIDKNQLESVKSANVSEKPEEVKIPDEKSSSNSVMWEFKWIDKEGEPVHGPCSSEHMQKWLEEGYFKDGVWVRRCDQPDAKFYSSKRIDFELYM